MIGFEAELLISVVSALLALATVAISYFGFKANVKRNYNNTLERQLEEEVARRKELEADVRRLINENLTLMKRLLKVNGNGNEV